MNPPWKIASALLEEWLPALELMFKHLPESQRRTRCANSLNLLAAGDIPEDGLLVARQDGVIVAALMCIPLPGASGLFWVPQVRDGFESTAVTPTLVRHGLNWLRARGAKLAQAFIHPDEAALAAPLASCGFQRVTQLTYLRHELRGRPAPLSGPRLLYETYQPANQELFQQTLLRTYQGTLDCPELNGRRTMAEIMDGHSHDGKCRPGLWWLAFLREEAVGVVLIAELPGGEGWDLSYLGVVPEARSRGIGRALTERVLREARQAHVPQLILAVDARNQPARQLYAKMGFLEEESREIFLFFFEDLAGSAERANSAART